MRDLKAEVGLAAVAMGKTGETENVLHKSRQQYDLLMQETSSEREESKGI